MNAPLPNLPIGIQNFAKLRSAGYLYVDKTARLMQLIQTGAWYFLARPRRFGKSLTLSTLDAMFRGETELFTGLEAEDWVREQARKPAPVLRLDMSMINTAAPPQFETALCEALARRGMEEDVHFLAQTPGGMLQDLVAALYRQHGPVVVLIDEYDKPILDHIGDLKLAEEMRLALQGF